MSDETRYSQEYFRLVSHQLRAPLVAMQTVIKVLMQPGMDDPEKNRMLLEQAYTRSEDMLSMVNDLLNLERARGRATEELREMDPVYELRFTIEKLRPVAEKKNVTLDIALEAAGTVMAGEEDLKLVFDNLVDNAIKYSRDDSEVEISLKEDAGFAVVEIRDSGIGIPEADIEKVFQDFHRGGNVREEKVHGTGLGLSLVKKVVQNLGGEIALESKENEGTAVTVKLPLKK